MLDTGLIDAVSVDTTAIVLGDNLFVEPSHAIIEKTRLVVEAGRRRSSRCIPTATSTVCDVFSSTAGRELTPAGEYRALANGSLVQHAEE